MSTKSPVRGSHEFFARQFETALDGILIFRLATLDIIDANPYLEGWLGYSREEWCSRTVLNAGVWDDTPQVRSMLATLAETGCVRVDELPTRSRGGKEYYAEIIASVYTLDGTELAQLNVRDVTARVNATRALSTSEARFRMFTENVLDYAMFLLDVEGCVESWNTGAERILGYAQHEIIGRSGSVFFTPEDLAQHEDLKEMQSARGIGRAEDERWHIRKDGSRFWASGVMTPVRDERGVLCGYAKVMRDITERKLAEEAVTRQADELARSNADLQEFAFVSSHDLQEPLRAVTLYAQLLERRYGHQLGPEAQDYVHYITTGTERMSAMIRDLLTYSRATSDGTSVVSRQADLEIASEWAMANLSSGIEEAGARITLDPLPVVAGNQAQLAQVLQNLLSNALKYRSSAPPEIHIGARRLDGMWEISVCDNGIGIDPQYHERIFGVFKRLHGREIPGTGIGLSLCRKLIRQNGGTLWVDSRKGEGSTFRFTVPVAPGSEPPRSDR
jgi:PAS domain S-box-containing protein